MIPTEKIDEYKRRAKLDAAKHLVNIADNLVVGIDGVNDERLDGFSGLAARGLPSLGELYTIHVELQKRGSTKAAQARDVIEMRTELNRIKQDVTLSAKRFEDADPTEKFDRGLDWAIQAARDYAYSRLVIAMYENLVEEAGVRVNEAG